MRNLSRRRIPNARLMLCLLSLGLGAGIVLATRGAAVRDYAAVRSNGVTVHLVTIDLAGDRSHLCPVVASAGGQEFSEIVSVHRPRAAINGGYFDPDFRPIGDVVCDGRLVARGGQRCAVAVTRSGDLVFRRREGRARFDWDGYRTALAAGPMLVCDGRPAVNPEADGFSRASRALRAPRSVIGQTRNNKLLLAVIEEPVTLRQTAEIAHRLGAVDAMNLDGGGSCALYADGRTIITPAARMSTVLLVTE